MSWFNVGATAITALGQINQGAAAAASGRLAAKQADYQAGIERENAQAQSVLIRKQRRYVVGSATAAAAASGVVAGEGSSGEINRQIYEDSEQDAYQAILSGNRRERELRLSGVASRTAGSIAQSNSNLQAFGTVLEGGYQAGKANGYFTNKAPATKKAPPP